MKRFQNILLQAPILALVWVSNALAGYDIESAGTSGGTIFQRIITFMQDIVDMLDGPVAIMVVIAGVVVAACMWIFAPDNRHLGKAMKAVAVGFVLFDIGLLVNYMRA